MLNCTWRFLGRLLISLILLISSYQKLHTPQYYYLSFSRGLTNLPLLLSSLSLPISLPDLLPYTILLIKFSGLFDAVIGLLILFGRQAGGVLGVVRFVVGMIAVYLPWSQKNVKSYSQRERLANTVGLLGVAVLLARRGRERNGEK